MEYRVKWCNYPSSKNRWEPIEGLTNCRESIDDFEKAQAQIIIGMKKANGTLYAMKFKDKSIQMVDSDEVKSTWPTILENYFMERIQFTMVNCADTTGAIESPNVVFITNPVAIILGEYYFSK